MGNSTDEKRLSQRLVVETATVNPEGKTNHPILKDISTGGMQFSTPVGHFDIQTGDLINFSIKFPNTSTNNIWGEIRHMCDFADQTTHFGVKFLKVNWPVWKYLSQYQHDVIDITAIEKLSAEEHEKINSIQQQVSHDSYHIKLVTHRPLDGKLEDINFGGAKLHLDDPIEIDSPVTTTFFFEKNMLVIEGVCVWCSRINQETKSFLVGVNFKRLDQNQFYLLSELVLKLSHLV